MFVGVGPTGAQGAQGPAGPKGSKGKRGKRGPRGKVVKVKKGKAARRVTVAVNSNHQRVAHAAVVIAVRGHKYLGRTSARGVATFRVAKHGKVRVVSPS